MSIAGSVGTSVKTDVNLRQDVVVSSVRERGHLGAGGSHARALFRFVHIEYMLPVINF